MKMIKTPAAILFLSWIITTSGIAQTNGEFPNLHITEIIQGSETDIGYWGDGKVYVIELWGTWCAPCIKNIPKLTAMQQKYESNGLIVIGYSWEDPGKVRNLLDRMEESMRYTLVNDQDEKFLKVVAEEKEMVESFPFSFVIGRKGELLWSGNPENGLEEFMDDYFKRN
jgi:thiol-disulfide isomerase/thioredoxin